MDGDEANVRRRRAALGALPVAVLVSAALVTSAGAALPGATTGPATSVSGTSATLTGKVNPNNLATTYYFQYGPTKTYGSQTSTQGPTPAGKQNVPVSAGVGGLAPGTTYHYRLVAVNASGTKLGGDRTFSTTASLSLQPRPDPVTFGRSVVIAGQLTSGAPAGVKVTLKESPFPFLKFTNVATARTDALGRYSFTRTPPVNTRYMTVAAGRPAAQSATRLVLVRIKLTLGVSSTRPRRGQRVVFSGIAAPPQAGRLVLIERLVRGAWRRVGHTRLTGAVLASRYRVRIRIAHAGLYRAHVGHDASHAPGISVARRLRLR